MDTLYSFLYGISDWLLHEIAWIVTWLGLKELYFISDFLISPEVVTLVNWLLTAIVYFIVVFFVGLTFIWMDRKFMGRFMDRRGTQVGVLGLFQNFADGIKTLLKEHIVPKDTDHALYEFAAFAILATSAMLLGCIPMSTRFFIINVDLALLLGLAIFCLAPFGILIGGWASNNKFSLIGGMRAAAQLIAYEIPMLVVVVSVVILTQSLSFMDIVQYQQEHIWLIVPLFVGAITFFVAALAESERVPFDLPEAEAELVEGWQTEYGGFRWGLIMLCDYLRAYIACALVVLLFLGGWDGPSIVWPEIWYLLKTFIVFFFFIWVRVAMVRIRTDQILFLGWRRLLPLSVINLLIAIGLKTMGVF